MLVAGRCPRRRPRRGRHSFVVQKNASAETLDVLDNDTVAPGDAISATTDPTHGTVTLADDGLSVTYEPDAGYTGPDTFDYTVTNDPDGELTATVTIKVNAPPVAVDDPAAGCFPPDPFGGSFPILEDSATITFAGADCDLTGNDTDADGTIVAWDVTGGQGHGTAVWLPNQPGSSATTPDTELQHDGRRPAGRHGGSPDSLTYQAHRRGWRAVGARRRSGIGVAPVNDAPTFTPGALYSPPRGRRDGPYSAALGDRRSRPARRTVVRRRSNFCREGSPGRHEEPRVVQRHTGHRVGPRRTLTFTPDRKRLLARRDVTRVGQGRRRHPARLRSRDAHAEVT